MAIGLDVRTLRLPSIDRRMLLGGLLAAITAFGVLAITRPPERMPVLVAGSDLPSGTPLGELDVTVRYVENATGLVSGSEVGELDGWSLRVPLAEGEPLVTSMLQPPQLMAMPNVMALSLDVSHAVLGRLAPGDAVDVYVTTDGDLDSDGETLLLASDVYVVDAEIPDGAIDRDTVNMLLAVDDGLAEAIASAADGGHIDLVRVGR